MMRMWIRFRERIFFRASLPRTIGETILLGAICWLGATLFNLFLSKHLLEENAAFNRINLYGWFGVLDVCWFVVRLRIPEKTGRRESLFDLLGATFVSAVLCGLQTPAVMTFLDPVLSRNESIEMKIFV